MNAKFRKSGQDRTSPQARGLGQGIWQGWTTGTFWLFEMFLQAAVKETWRQSSRAPKRGNRAGGVCQSSSTLWWPGGSTSSIRGSVRISNSATSSNVAVARTPRVSNSTHAPAATSRFSRTTTACARRSRVTQSLFPNLLNPLPRRPES